MHSGSNTSASDPDAPIEMSLSPTMQRPNHHAQPNNTHRNNPDNSESKVYSAQGLQSALYAAPQSRDTGSKELTTNARAAQSRDPTKNTQHVHTTNKNSHNNAQSSLSLSPSNNYKTSTPPPPPKKPHSELYRSLKSSYHAQAAVRMDAEISDAH